MNKKELLSAISEKTGVTIKASRDVLNAFQKIILEILKRDEVVVLLDLGKFRIVERAARSAINPSTKESILVSAKRKPSLVASKKFRAFTEGSESIDSFNYQLKSLLISLANKIYLSPTKHTINDCLSYLEQIKLDLERLKSIDTSGVSPYVLKKEFNLTPSKIEFSYKSEEDATLNALTDSYEFTNIKEKANI